MNILKWIYWYYEITMIQKMDKKLFYEIDFLN